MKNTKKLATLSVIVALAMVLSFLESRIPAFVAIPGIKVGLANIAVIFTVYKLGAREGVLISIIRVLLVSILFGSTVSLWYSLAGAILSLIVTILLKKYTKLAVVTVSVAGGVSHNLAQIGVACLLLETNIIVYYLPFLLLSGTVAGIAVGVASALLIKRVKPEGSR
jgi:heptaprenyl diphosphate synthase